MRADIISGNYGSIISICAASGRGRQWMAKHGVLADGRGEQVYCEHRYGVDIIYGALGDGLHVKDSASGKFATAPSDGN